MKIQDYHGAKPERHPNIAVLGVNHQTAPIQIRETLAFEPGEATEFLRQCKALGLIKGGVLLSTCNRMEVFVESEMNGEELWQNLSRYILEYKRLPVTQRKYFDFKEGRPAIETLFLLSSGYLSMVRGETQISGQIREAVQIARTSGNTTNVLLRLFDKSNEVAKKIRSNQQVFAVNRSAGAAAVEQILEIDGENMICEHSHLILGAGQMAVTLVQALKSVGAKKITLYNRTEERANRFAETHGISSVFHSNQLSEAISGISYIWVATSVSTPIITTETLTPYSQDLVIYDLGLPRNVEARVGELEQVRLYCIDDLDDKSGAVETEIPKESMDYINTGIEEFVSWCHSLQIRDVFSIIRDDAEELFANELKKATQGVDQNIAEALEQYNQQLTKVYSSTMIARLRKVVDETKDPIYADVIKRLLTE